MLHLVSEIKHSKRWYTWGAAKRCWSLQQLIFLLPGSPASPTKKTGPQKQKHGPPRAACLLRCQNQLWVRFGVRWTGLQYLPWLSHLQLYTSTEERPWQSSRWCFNQMAGMAWQSTHSGGSSLPEAVCSTWRQIKHAWCPATTVNMPGQERQRGCSPTEPSLGSYSGSGCYRKSG